MKVQRIEVVYHPAGIWDDPLCPSGGIPHPTTLALKLTLGLEDDSPAEQYAAHEDLPDETVPTLLVALERLAARLREAPPEETRLEHGTYVHDR